MSSRKNTKMSASEVNVDDVVFNSVLSFLDRQNVHSWTGTMTELNSGLVRVSGRKISSVLPGSPSALRVVLNRVVNRLRNRKVGVRFGRTTDHTRTRYVRFTR
jgi:hypothetical protein